MRLAIVHYHLRRGGVTRVIASALEALGEAAGKAVVLSSTPSEEPLPCPVAVIPELAYTRSASPQAARSLAREMMQEASRHCGGAPDLWHVHNHSLGKNANFPEALRRIASTRVPVLLQIHDFAEDGRPDNYRVRQAPFTDGTFDQPDTALYPVAPQIGYAVLNERDRRILRDAGVPEPNLYTLPNPVSASGLPPVGKPESAAESPLILYPTRGIRRKNLGEVLLWSLACPDHQFATTLAPKNPEWLPGHDAWAELVRELGLPVRLAAAEENGQSFESLIHQARAILTTSVAEGFGLAFLEPWLWGKPLLGRNLPEITADFTGNGIQLRELYSEWPVALDLFDAEAQKERFLRAVSRVFKAYVREVSLGESESAWGHLTRQGTIDFGRLDEIAQAEVIRCLAGQPARERPQPPHGPDGIVSAPIADNAAAIRDLYGFGNYRTNLLGIYKALRSASPAPPEGIHAGKVLDGFLDLRRFNLLRC